MPGTRKDVLRLINAWLNDLNEPNIFWLSGSPGSGKTTIASTVVADFYCVSGSCFFDRNEAELRDPDNLWRCIAFDLCLGSNDLEKSIARALETQRANIKDLDISMQFEHLIAKPLQEVFGTAITPILVVVDALDECDSYEKLLPSLTAWSYLPKSVKLLISSRCYGDIQSSLSSVSVHTKLHTGHKMSIQTSDDLVNYFIGRFFVVPGLYPYWPGPAIVSLLVRKAAGLFIWAKCAMDFILYTGGDPEERLDLVSAGLEDGVDAVDSLYHEIISSALQGLTEQKKIALTSVLGTIAIAENPLCTQDLKVLLGVNDALLNSIIGQLSPILSISDANYLHFCHQSVADFLLDPERSKKFGIDGELHSLYFSGYLWNAQKDQTVMNHLKGHKDCVTPPSSPPLSPHHLSFSNSNDSSESLAQILKDTSDNSAYKSLLRLEGDSAQKMLNFLQKVRHMAAQKSALSQISLPPSCLIVQS